MKNLKEIEGNPFQSVTAEEDKRAGLLEIDMFYLTGGRGELKKHLEDVAIGRSKQLFVALEGAYGCGKTATIDFFVRWINEDLEIQSDKEANLRLNFGENKCYAIKIELEKSFTLNKVIEEIADQIMKLMENEGINTSDMEIKLIAKDMEESEDKIRKDLERDETRKYVKRQLRHFGNVNNDNFIDYVNVCLEILKERISNFGKLFIFIDEGELATFLASGETSLEGTEVSMRMLLRILPKKQQEEEILSHSCIIFSFAETTLQILKRIDPELFGPKGRNPKSILIGKTDENEFKEFSKFVINKRLEKWREKHDLDSKDSYPISETLIEKIAFDPHGIFMQKKNIRTVIGIFRSLWDIWKTKEDVVHIDELLFISSFQRLMDEISVPDEMKRKFDIKFKQNIEELIHARSKDEMISNTAYNIFEILIGGFVFGPIEKKRFISNLTNGAPMINTLKCFDSSRPDHKLQREKYINEAFGLLCSVNDQLREHRQHIFDLKNDYVILNEKSLDRIFVTPTLVPAFDPDKFISNLLDNEIRIGKRPKKIKNLSICETIERGLWKYWKEKTQNEKSGFKNLEIYSEKILDEKIEYLFCDIWISDNYPQYKLIIMPRLDKETKDVRNARISRELLKIINNPFSILVIFCRDGIFLKGYYGKEEVKNVEFLEKYGEKLGLREKLEIEDLLRIMLLKDYSTSEEEEHKNQKEKLIGDIKTYGKEFYYTNVVMSVDYVSKTEYKMFIIDSYLEDTNFDTLAKYDQNLTKEKMECCLQVFSEIGGKIRSREISTKDAWEDFIKKASVAAVRTHENCKILLKELNFVDYKGVGDEIVFKYEDGKGFRKVKEKIERLFTEGKDELTRKEVYRECLAVSKSTKFTQELIDLYLEVLKFSGYIDIENDKIIQPKKALEIKKNEIERNFMEIEEVLITLGINEVDICVLYNAYKSLNEMFEQTIKKERSKEYDLPETLAALTELQFGDEIDLPVNKEILSNEMKISEIKNISDLTEFANSMKNRIKASSECLPNQKILKKITDMNKELEAENIDTKDLGDFANDLLDMTSENHEKSLYRNEFYLISKRINDILCRIDDSLKQISDYTGMKSVIEDMNELVKKSNKVLGVKHKEIRNCNLLNIDLFKQFLEDREEFWKTVNRLLATKAIMKSLIKKREEWTLIYREIEKIKEVRKGISNIEITELVVPQELKENENIGNLPILKEIKKEFDDRKRDTEKKLGRMMKMCEVLIGKSVCHMQMNRLLDNANLIQKELKEINLKIEEWREWTDKFNSYLDLNENYSNFEKLIMEQKDLIKEMIKSDDHAPSLEEIPPDIYMEILKDKFEYEKKLKDIFMECREIENISQKNRKLAAVIELICLELLE